MSERKKFSLKRKEIPLTLEHEDGTEHEYTIRELVGEQRDQYLNMASKKAKNGPDGKPVGVGDYTGLCSDLLSMCVYNAQNQLVLSQQIKAWPASTQVEIFKLAQELSGLTAGAATEAKND